MTFEPPNLLLVDLPFCWKLPFVMGFLSFHLLYFYKDIIVHFFILLDLIHQFFHLPLTLLRTFLLGVCFSAHAKIFSISDLKLGIPKPDIILAFIILMNTGCSWFFIAPISPYEYFLELVRFADGLSFISNFVLISLIFFWKFFKADFLNWGNLGVSGSRSILPGMVLSKHFEIVGVDRVSLLFGLILKF